MGSPSPTGIQCPDPKHGLIENEGKLSMKILRIGFVFGGFLSLVLSVPAQTFTRLHSFKQTDGANPQSALIQATNGNFYGTTSSDGDTGQNSCGTVFRITQAGKLTTLYSFPGSNDDWPDGCVPVAALVQGTNGNFYGTTQYGGNGYGPYGSWGTVFEITPGGVLTTLHKFCSQLQNNICTDGAAPRAALVQGADGNFYGTTSTGYIAYGPTGGTVFKITPNGVLTTLYTFCSQVNCTDGNGPYAGLVQGADGNFYGTTILGGIGGGTVFKITPSGELTTLYRFCQQIQNYPCTDGSSPEAALVQGSDGNFYGTTVNGGPSNPYGYTYGTVFKITPNGTLTTLHGFEGPDGAAPEAGLIQANDGNFYGTTSYGGANNPDGGAGYPYGTAFEITPSGTLTTLHNFCSQLQDSICTDGNNPAAALVQATNGAFYGATNGGGNGPVCYPDGCNLVNAGAIFSLSLGLSPFVEIQPASGKVGAGVKIRGANLTGATSVTFNGTAAVFKVVSSAEITATVPTGAGTGFVTVTTPSGTLASNHQFLVTPKITSFTPPSGPVGTSVTITGVSLTQTTTVTFGGVQASTFNVNSDMQVTATVPTGAVTGKVAITTAGGAATSAKSFKVTR